MVTARQSRHRPVGVGCPNDEVGRLSGALPGHPANLPQLGVQGTDFAFIVRSMVETNGAVDPRSPIDLFTFFLELRRALPVPSGLINVSYVPGDELWEGWTEVDVAGLVGGSEPGAVPVGSVPHTAMAIRHLAEEEPAPLSRVEGAYGD